jgi:hypothetical protein
LETSHILSDFEQYEDPRLSDFIFVPMSEVRTAILLQFFQSVFDAGGVTCSGACLMKVGRFV